MYQIRELLGLRKPKASKFQRAWLIGQGSYYIITGLWPVIHMASFEKVTGPKIDGWLVKTTGMLIACIGGVLLWAGIRRERPQAVQSALGVGTALSLGGSDLLYSSRGRISQVYAYEGVVEMALAVVGVILWVRRK